MQNQTTLETNTGRSSAAPLSASERAELESLRREVARLNATTELADDDAPKLPPTVSSDSIPPLSEETRRALKKLGYQRESQGIQSNGRYRPHRVCSQCGQLPGLVHSEHPLDKQIQKAKRQRVANKNNPRALMEINAHLRQLEGFRNSTSRCCGKRYVEVVLDHQEALWHMWVKRKERVNATLEQLHRAYGPGSQNRDEDFLILRTLMAVGDRKIGKLVAVFRREEEIQRAATEVQSAEVG